MKAEIIAIGHEVVDGTILNSNANWLAQQLGQQGLEVARHSAIPDDENAMLEAFEIACRRSQVVLCTGGLGPTVDDFTIEIAAKFFKKNLVQHAESLQQIQNIFRKLGRTLNPNQEKQALIPKGSQILMNEVGTAPGIYYQHQGVHFAFFPGVPREMKTMFESQFLPILLKISQGIARRQLKIFKCFGIPEGQMDHQLRKELAGRLSLRHTQIGYRVSFPFVEIRLYAQHQEEAIRQEMLESGAAIVRQALGRYIFTENDESLAQVVLRQLQEKQKTLSLAESCTGGLVSHQLTEIPGASQSFLGSVVSYSDAMKIDFLGVRPETLQTFGAVSEATVLEMARGIRKRTHSDYALAVSGFAGPHDAAAGTVFIALCSDSIEEAKKFNYPFDRERFKLVTAATILNELRLKLSPKITSSITLIK